MEHLLPLARTLLMNATAKSILVSFLSLAALPLTGCTAEATDASAEGTHAESSDGLVGGSADRCTLMPGLPCLAWSGAITRNVAVNYPNLSICGLRLVPTSWETVSAARVAKFADSIVLTSVLPANKAALPLKAVGKTVEVDLSPLGSLYVSDIRIASKTGPLGGEISAHLATKNASDPVGVMILPIECEK